MPLISSAPVGLDIGASAVRAARITTSKRGAALSTFAQVALPSGAVVDGEIRDPGVVSEAIAELWKRARLRSKKAVIGVANQRVVVRQVEMPYLQEAELRASLPFQAGEHIPMPVEGAQLDFQIINDYLNDEEHMMRVLLVAAEREMLETFISTASAAGIETVSVDLAPFAAARAVSSAARGEIGMDGAEAIVDVGAAMTNIVVHHNGDPHFVRILPLGGGEPTDALADHLGVTADEAEAVKTELSAGVGSTGPRRLMHEHVVELANEIRGSLDYYSASDESESLTSVILTGGGSLIPGLVEQLEASLNTQVRRATPLDDVDVSRSGLTPEQVEQIEPVAATAIGLVRDKSVR
jgi:type IV pilus assembly protein PilM